MNNIGLYIHIPFCNSKCPYCDFYSFRADDDTKTDMFRLFCESFGTIQNNLVVKLIRFISAAELRRFWLRIIFAKS